MLNSRAPAASARPKPQGAAAVRFSNASDPPSTPVRDLRVRTASQVTPLTGNLQKRQRDTLLSEQQQSPTRTPAPRASAESPSHHLPVPGSAAPRTTVAAAATSPLRAQGTASARSPADEHLAHPKPNSASGPAAKSRKKPPSKRLHDYRLLSSPSTSAFDVAARGGLKDNGVFVILAEDDPTRVKPYWEIRNSVNDALADVGSVGRVATVDPVKTGLALTLTRTSKTQEVLQHAEAIKLALTAEQVTLRKPAIIMVLADIPVRVNDIVVEDDDPFLQEEIELALDARLACPPRRLCKPEDLTTRKTTAVWIAIDPDSPTAARPRRLRIMQRWCHLRPFIDRSTPPLCSICWSYGHSHDACSHSPRCRQCGSHSHDTEEHTCDLCGGKDPCVPLCTNCTGPHSPEDSACKAKPTFDAAVNGFVIPVGQRLHRIKQAASRDRREIVKNLSQVS
ncbi:hypothetical protein A4X09_0g1302 [Tilletia walkeri]|uniref:Uncharacterized protein n=1 Tax=Tilletia walkeri TaxID=117179 RepID=A0A8X7T6T0_9BASI|nr:hypothetical protein A4X09_0g1302 [Tilletia walkeri]